MAQERVEERQERSEEWPEPQSAAAAPAEVESPPDDAEEQELDEQEPEAEAAPAESEEESEEEEVAAVAAEHAAGGLDIPDEVAVIEGEAKGGMRPVAIVVGKFNGEIT